MHCTRNFRAWDRITSCCLPTAPLKAAPEDKSRIKHSSVLLLLFEEENRLNVLLIKRPQHMKHHAGQMALPGGRIEPGETAVDTALRETWEEIGVKKEAIEILGELSEFYVEVSRFQIKPIGRLAAQKA